jgi:hypothetical protein
MDKVHEATNPEHDVPPSKSYGGEVLWLVERMMSVKVMPPDPPCYIPYTPLLTRPQCSALTEVITIYIPVDRMVRCLGTKTWKSAGGRVEEVCL